MVKVQVLLVEGVACTHVALMIEALFSPVGLLATAVTVLVFLYYKFVYLPHQVLRRCGVPGPKPLPLIGNVLQLTKGVNAFIERFHSKYGAVFGYYTANVPVIIVADPDIIKQIMVKQFDNFRDRDRLLEFLAKPPFLLFARGDTWTTLRQTLSPSFSAAKMKMMVPLIQRSIDTLLRRFGQFAESGKSHDVFGVFGAFTMEVTLAVAFGRVVNVQQGEADDLTEAALSLFAGMQDNTILRTVMEVVGRLDYKILRAMLRFLYEKGETGKNFKLLREAMLEVVQARRQSKENGRYKDLLQLMVDTTGEEELEEGEQAIGRKVKRRPLTNEEIVSNSVGFLLAGYDTTGNALSYTSYLLAVNPSVQEKLQAEIDSFFEQNPDASVHSAIQNIPYVEQVILESLRVFPPAPRAARCCLRETVINGITFPKDCNVILPFKILQHDPQYWSDPQIFDPERFSAEEKAKRHPYVHLPFGGGPRGCIGKMLALLEIKMVLVETMRKFSFVQSPETEVPLQTVYGVTMSPKNGIYILLVARETKSQ